MDKEKKPTRINSVIEEKKSSPFIEGEIIQKTNTKDSISYLSTIEKLKSLYQLKLKGKNQNSTQQINNNCKGNSDLEKFASMVDNEKRKEIEEIALLEEEKKERLTNEILEENFDILEEKKENENIIIDNQKEKPYILEMLPNLYDDEDDIKAKNKEKNNQKKEELKVIKEIKGKPSKISLNKKKGIISKKKEPIFQILPSKMVSEKEKSKNDKFCDSFFLVSFSKDCKIIENSINNQADCNHSICNSLHAIKPEFIYISRGKKGSN